MTAIRHDDGVIACEYIRCPAEADVWAWDGARWRRFCGRHNAALVSTLDVGLYRSSWDHPLDGDPPPPPVAPPVPDAGSGLDAAHSCRASEPEPAPPLPCEVPDALTLAPPAASRLTGGAKASSATAAPPSTPEPPCTPSAPSSPSPAAEPDSSTTVPASSSSESAPATPSRRYRGQVVLPLVLRADADAHPDLCRVAGCERPPTTRGLCRSDAERARDAGTIDALGLPPLSPASSARLGGMVAGRGRPKSSSPSPSEPPMSPPLEPSPQLRVTKTCKVEGCTDRVTAHNCCNVHYSRAKTCGLNPATATGAEIVEAWTARRAEIEARRDPEAENPLQVIRGLLGCDPDGPDAEVVEAVKRMQRWLAAHREPLPEAPRADVMSTDSPTPKRLVPTEHRTVTTENVVYRCDPPPPVYVSHGHSDTWWRTYQDADGDWTREDRTLDLTGYTIVAEGEPAPGEATPSTDAFTPEHVGGSAVARITAALGLDPTASLDEVVEAVGALKGTIHAAHEALDAMPAATAPDCITPAQRIEYATRGWFAERREASRLATLCQDAHDALTAAGVSGDGDLAERVRRLAEGLNDALTEKIAHLKVTLRLPDRTAEVEVLDEAVDRLKAAPTPTAGGLSPSELACARHLLDELYDAATSGGQVPMSGFVVLALRALVLREVSRG